MTREWILERIAATKAAIVAHEAALLEVQGGARSYSLDSGQTRQQVNNHTLRELTSTLSSLENRLAVYQARLGCGRTRVIPGF